MEKSPKEYQIVKGIASDEELESYRLCFENNGSPRDLSNLKWLHQQNPANTNTIYYAMFGNEVAAIYTAIPVIFRVNGEVKTALQSIDTMTDVKHRGKGLFPKLANRLYDDAAKGEFELVYGFPNENSAPGFFNKLKWISFGEAPFLLKPLRLSYFLKKLLKQTSEESSEGNVLVTPIKKMTVSAGTEIVEITSFDQQYDHLWQNVSTKTTVAVDRSAAYMNWRYITKPGEHYLRYGLFENGSLTAAIVFTLKDKHGGRIGYIMELINEDANVQAGLKLLKFASTVFKSQHTDAALAWCFPHSFNYAAFKKAGYFSLPVKFRPQHLFFGTRPFKDEHTALISDIKNWYISYSDSDTV